MNILKSFIFILVFCNTTFAQFKIDTNKRVNYLAIPVLFRTPETGWAFGASSSASFKTTHRNDSLTRISVIQVLGIFSQREQNIQGVDASIYFPKEKYMGDSEGQKEKLKSESSPSMIKLSNSAFANPPMI